MTNEELLAKIREEIERRRSLLTQHSKLTYDLILETFIKEYDDLLSFLSTLESEKPINPADAMKEIEEKIALVKQRGSWDGVDVDKFMDEVRGREPEKPVPNDLDFEQELYNHFGQIKDFTLGMRIGQYFYELGKQRQKEQDEEEQADLFTIVALDAAQRAREQMLKDAVEGEIVATAIGHLRIVAEANEKSGVKDGDKVRIIVCKNED